MTYSSEASQLFSLPPDTEQVSDSARVYGNKSVSDTWCRSWTTGVYSLKSVRDTRYRGQPAEVYSIRSVSDTRYRGRSAGV